jgi:hypothetical protein
VRPQLRAQKRLAMLDTASKDAGNALLTTESLWLTISELSSSCNRRKPKCAGHGCGNSFVHPVGRPLRDVHLQTNLERSAIGWRGSARMRAARALSDGRPSPFSRCQSSLSSAPCLCRMRRVTRGRGAESAKK